MTVVGKGIDRVDGRAKVMGKATYAAETAIANVAYGIIVGAYGGKGKTVIDASRRPRWRPACSRC